MKTRAAELPFENRWTNGETAHHWYLQLEQHGIARVRARQALRDQAEATNADDADAQIPEAFVRAWLTYHDQKLARRDFLWRSVLLAIVIVAAAAAVISAYYAADLHRHADPPSHLSVQPDTS
jgi:hypothetical protein